jgi:hypothetical protein
MKHRWKILFSALVNVGLFLTSGCVDPCSNTVVNEIVSPDGNFVATAFIRDCGATTDFSPQVELRPTGQKFGKVGNVYVGNHSDNIHVIWQSNTQLVIQCDAFIVNRLTNYQGVLIEVAPLIH